MTSRCDLCGIPLARATTYPVLTDYGFGQVCHPCVVVIKRRHALMPHAVPLLSRAVLDPMHPARPRPPWYVRAAYAIFAKTRRPLTRAVR